MDIDDNTNVRYLPISVRARNALLNRIHDIGRQLPSIETVGQIRNMTDAQLLEGPGLGEVSLTEIQDCVGKKCEGPPDVDAMIEKARRGQHGTFSRNAAITALMSLGIDLNDIAALKPGKMRVAADEATE